MSNDFKFSKRKTGNSMIKLIAVPVGLTPVRPVVGKCLYIRGTKKNRINVLFIVEKL